MAGDEKPWWHDMREEQKAKARERIAQLLAASPAYPRPPADPDIYWTAIDNRIAMVDRKTGDYFHSQTRDEERLLIDFDYKTKTGELVCIFKVQMSGGYGMKWERVPIRIFRIEEAERQSDDVRAARRRMSIERFAEFMAAYPDFARNPERNFVVIDAPRQDGERL